MRCREGDRALVVNSAIETNIGRIVQVLEFMGDNPIVTLGGKRCLMAGYDVWKIAPALIMPYEVNRPYEDNTIYAPYTPDEWLPPLRPQDYKNFKVKELKR